MRAHEPTDRSRQVVETASGLGIPQKFIAILAASAAASPCSENTLRIHYQEELDAGKAKAIFAVAKTLFDRATTGKDLGAAIFYLKAQAGWREKHVLDDADTRDKLSTIAALVMASGLNDAPAAPEPYLEGESTRLIQ